MQNKPLFSVIIPTYNQARTIFESIDSVLIQDYENIELIVSDDGSSDFDSTALTDYVAAHQKGNVTNFQIQAHKQNVGLVRNNNSAFRKATGTYITGFAGDDLLFDEHTLSRYVQAFEEDPQRKIVTAQCHRYDSELAQLLYKQVNLERAYRMNDASPAVQFQMISEINMFAMGATAFKRKLLEKYGFFDERYKHVEDWPLFLKMTRNGEKFHFVDFAALKHRAGGISARRSKENNLRLRSRDFCLDLLGVFEREIFPYMKDFPAPDQFERVTRYMALLRSNADMLSNTVYENERRVKIRFFLRYPSVAIRLFLKNRRR